jgi:hypothetical protein
MANLCAATLVLFQQSIGIFDADPNPAATVSLVTLAQENVALAAAHGREIRALPVHLNPKGSNGVLDAGRNISHAQDGGDSFKPNR